MTWLDALLIQVYLLAIFAIVIKAQVPLSLYRTLKWLATLFCIYIVVALVANLHPLNWSFAKALRLVPLPFIVYVLLRTEVSELLQSLGFHVNHLLFKNAVWILYEIYQAKLTLDIYGPM